MHDSARFIILSLGIALLNGACMKLPMGGTRPDPAYAPVSQEQYVQPAPANGSIYRAGYDVRLFEDLRARQVGDILTVLLVENTDASKSMSTDTSKQNEVELGNPTVFGVPLEFGNPHIANLGMNLESSQEFSGSGSSTQSNSLKGSLSVMVSEVLPNGNLVVRGEKIIGLNQGDEYVRLHGIVRPYDIQPDNTVLSTHVANARINYGGKGPVSSAAILGWLAKFFLTFAPF